MYLKEIKKNEKMNLTCFGRYTKHTNVAGRSQTQCPYHINIACSYWEDHMCSFKWSWWMASNHSLICLLRPWKTGLMVIYYALILSQNSTDGVDNGTVPRSWKINDNQVSSAVAWDIARFQLQNLEHMRQLAAYLHAKRGNCHLRR